MPVQIHNIIEAIHKAFGNQSLAAQMLGMSVDALNKRVQRSSKLRQEVNKALERKIEFAENKLISHINSKDERVSLSATKFLLMTQGKHKGYYTKIEKDENVTVPIIVDFKVCENEKKD